MKSVFSKPLPATIPALGDVLIQIEGDVAYPGVYRVKEKLKARALFNKAGGSHVQVNQSDGDKWLALTNGQKFTLKCFNGECRFSVSEMPSFYKIVLGIPLSLNHESAEGLTAVHGIGPKLAESIVRTRNRSGGFKKLEDLLEITGIGENLFRSIKPYLGLP